MNHAREGRPIPTGRALDSAGNPTTDPNVGLQGSMAAAGGYKGVGAALMVEIMAAAMTGATLGAHAAPFFGTAGGPPKTGQFFIAIDPAVSPGAFAADALPRLPGRVTRRSDVAFWLHLVTAPALLFSLLLLIFINFRLWESHGTANAVITILIVAGMMLVGIFIDRRAFVTSGLISLGVAVYYMFVHESGLGERFQASALSLVVVGLVVLSLGSCWRALRRLIIPRLPPALQAKLPPVQKTARARPDPAR